jgi:alpha-mannosidase
MALTIEWKRRIDNWRKELPRHFYRPLQGVNLSGFITTEQLTVDQAAQRDFFYMPPGTCWGAKWEYAWLQGEVVLPQAAAGRRIALAVDVGGESAIYVNGVAVGARDRQHGEITLTTDATPDTRYEIMIESYAGHGPMVVSAGPIPPGRQTVPEPPATQAMIGETTYGIWEEDAYQLWVDVETLYGIRESIDPNSLRVVEIDKGLRDFSTIVDYELEHDDKMATMRACRERLAPLLACENGSTAPTMYAFGHSHIDVAWLWPLTETERKCVRTLSTQLALMEEYPEYRYLQSQPHLYRMVQQRYPALYERVKAAAARGQLIPEGGMWVEADTNLSGGESLIRQFIHGKRFFRDEFGVNCEMLWLPDVFGYSGAMPQIMQGCGIKYFATAKIFWAYNGGDPFPYNTFTWEGIDGSGVLVHLCNDYNSTTDAATIIERWNQRVQKDDIATRMLPFGYGDGGGGPTRNHLESLRRLGNLEGVPMTRIAHPLDYFHDQEARGIPEARYVGELYFQAHRGTYTSQAKTKRGNRKSELALREAEMWDSVTRALSGHSTPADALDEAWKTVLLNQFHDIIPGSSIQRVYEEAEADYARVIDTAEEIAAEAAGSLTDGSDDLTVFNSLSWPRSCLIALPEGYDGATGTDGHALPAQDLDGDLLVEVTVPACGWTTVRAATTPPADVTQVTATERSLENEFLRVTLNDHGEISSIWDKEAGRELATGPCNSLRMYKDVPTHWDAWDLDSMYALTPVALDEAAEISVIAQGPLVGMVEVRRQLNLSPMVQQISLRRGSRRIEFDTEIDWQETHKMLKVAFPVSVYAHEAVHEIQFGHIRRPNHLSRPFDADRFEVANHKWTALVEEGRGCAVLNDCKYGVNVLGDTIMLTLLKSALAPDMYADKGLQEFSYALYAWNGSFIDSDVVREAYEMNCPVMTVSGGAGERSVFQVSAPNVVIETVKLAEDGSGDIVVRLYEAKRTATRCTLHVDLPLASAELADMLEENARPLHVDQGAVTLDLRPFEIATLRLKIGS